MVVTNSPFGKQLDFSEVNNLCYLVGWSLKAGNTDYKVCVRETTFNELLPTLSEYSKLTILKEYKVNALKHPSEVVFKTIKVVESVFRRWAPAITKVKTPKHFCFLRSLLKLNIMCLVHAILLG